MVTTCLKWHSISCCSSYIGGTRCRQVYTPTAVITVTHFVQVKRCLSCSNCMIGKISILFKVTTSTDVNLLLP